jgi:hypothetical protein
MKRLTGFRIRDGLKRRCNSYSLAYKLPREIIGAILPECHNAGLSYNTRIDSEAHDLCWISTATELCAPWRAAALAYPTLWDHVEYKFNNRSIALRMIKVAQSRSLNVAVHFNERAFGTLRLEKKVIERAASLYLTGLPANFFKLRLVNGV